MAGVIASISPPPTPPLKDINRDTPSPGSPRNVERPPRSSSPDTCPICLDEFDESKDRAYSNNCFHFFCFECLLEWSNNKRECPLCKKAFKSIRHKFKENGGYEVHQLPPLPPPIGNMGGWNPVISFEWMSQMRVQFIRHRHRRLERLRNVTARPSPLGMRNPMRPHTAERRRFLYQYQLYCEGATTPGGAARYRRCTPDFYRSNPALVHRLMPWLNRELVAILPSRDNVEFVVNHILSEIKKVDIRSPAFRHSIRRFTLQYTDQFIHEFYQFAISPFEMADFDRYARYPNRPSAARQAARTGINLYPDNSHSSRIVSSHDSSEPAVAVVPLTDVVPLDFSASTVRDTFERRRWHRQRLAEELSTLHRTTSDLLSVPRRRSGFVLNSAEDVVESDAPPVPRRRSGLVLSSADGGIHPDIDSSVNSSRRERLSNQQRMAISRLERSMRQVDEHVGGSQRADTAGHLLPSRHATTASRHPTSETLPIPSDGGNHSVSSLLSLAEPAADRSEPTIVTRVRSFLDNIDDELSNDAAPNTRSLSMPPYPEFLADDDEDTTLAVHSPLMSRSNTNTLFPFYGGLSRTSSSSPSANSSIDRRVRSPSPSLSSHSSDVILVKEERPYRARTPIVLTTSESETESVNDIGSQHIDGSRRLSNSSDSTSERSKNDTRLKKLTAKRRRHSAVRLSQSADEDSNLVSSENIRVVSESADSDCLVTFEAAKPKKHSNRNLSDDEAGESATKKRKKLKKHKSEKRKERDLEKKIKKRKSHCKESKHHKHVLTDFRHSFILDDAQLPAATNSGILTDSTAHRSSQSKLPPSSSTTIPSLHTPTSQSSVSTSSSFSPTESKHLYGLRKLNNQFPLVRDGGSRQRCSSPQLDVTTVETEATSDVNDTQRVASSSSQTNTTTPKAESQSISHEEWFLDYSDNGYKHHDKSIKKNAKDIRKQIRYFAKNNIARKYEDKKYKKHDKGHKN